jgi:hypothetical protein
VPKKSRKRAALAPKRVAVSDGNNAVFSSNLAPKLRQIYASNFGAYGARTRKLTAEISRQKNAPAYGCTRENDLRKLSRNVFDKRASTCTIGHFFCLELSPNNAKREKSRRRPLTIQVGSARALIYRETYCKIVRGRTFEEPEKQRRFEASGGFQFDPGFLNSSRENQESWNNCAGLGDKSYLPWGVAIFHVVER